MGVLLLCEGFGNMAESTRDDVRRFTRLQPQRGLGVSKVVEADSSKPDLLDDPVELLGYNVGVEWCTVGAGCRLKGSLQRLGEFA
jgi:hypothetical protein